MQAGIPHAKAQGAHHKPRKQANYNSRDDEMKGYMNDEATPLTIITKTITIFFI